MLVVSVKSKEGISEIIKFSSQGTVCGGGGGDGLQSGGGERKKKISAILFCCCFVSFLTRLRDILFFHELYTSIAPTETCYGHTNW